MVAVLQPLGVQIWEIRMKNKLELENHNKSITPLPLLNGESDKMRIKTSD